MTAELPNRGWYPLTYARRSERGTGRSVLLLTALAGAVGCSPRAGVPASDARPAPESAVSVPTEEYRVRFTPARTLRIERSGGWSDVHDVALLRGRVRGERGDTLVLGIMELRASTGRALKAPLGSLVTVSRTDPAATVEALPVPASARKTVSTSVVVFALVLIAVFVMSFRLEGFDT